MQTGLTRIDGKRYYFDLKTGKMQTGLIDLGNNCYMYFLKEGGVLTGAQKIDGKLYLFSESGMPYIGWQTIDGKHTM